MYSNKNNIRINTIKMKLVVCSPSTKDFIKGDKYIVIKHPLTVEELEKISMEYGTVVAIGGGAVMDAAKMISRYPITAYPTTASGACMTSHAVLWEGTKKISVKTAMPKEVIINEDFLISVPLIVLRYSYYDALCHFTEGLMSKNATKESTQLAMKGLKLLHNFQNRKELIEAGNIGGQVIEITGTNLYHSLSYPLTSYYGISHGKALGFLLGKEKIRGIDMEIVIDEALKYPKIHDYKFPITKKYLMERFK